MAYENYEACLVDAFGEDIKNGIVLPNNTDIQNNNARNKYNKYIYTLSSINPREYVTSEFEELDRRRVFEMSFSIIVEIFGNQCIPDALEYFSLLVPNGQKQVLNAFSFCGKSTEDGNVYRVVEIPDFETSSNIVTIVHEFVHYYLDELGVNYNKKRYYEEIIAILCEKIASKIVELRAYQSDFYNKMTEHRLEIISWHYNEHLKEICSVLDAYSTLEIKAKTDPTVRTQMMKAEQLLPSIRTSQGRSIISAYYQNLADAHGLGFLYSESLLAKYLDDTHAFQEQLKKLINCEISVQDLLTYYDINARNNEVYDRVYRRIDEIREFKKR